MFFKRKKETPYKLKYVNLNDCDRVIFFEQLSDLFAYTVAVHHEYKDGILSLRGLGREYEVGDGKPDLTELAVKALVKGPVTHVVDHSDWPVEFNGEYDIKEAEGVDQSK